MTKYNPSRKEIREMHPNRPVKARHVNDQGKAEIKKVLEENLKPLGRRISDEIVNEWAEEVNISLAEGNGPVLEIPARWDAQGQSGQFTLSNRSFAEQEIEE